MKRRSGKCAMGLLGALLLALASGCGAASAESPESEEAQANPERRGIGMGTPPPPQPPPPQPPPPQPPPPQGFGMDPRRSLVITDQAILSRFTFVDVMSQLVATSGVPTTALDLFHQWWDTARPTPPGSSGLFCDSPGVAGLNGYPYACPRAEGLQATVDPFVNPATNPNAYVPIGLFNRFDLASTSGSDCGEYRIVFARRAGFTNPNDRNLVIFEATLINPTPEAGLEGCRPVADFWRGLSDEADVNVRGTQLREFYFQGLPGFMPVLHVENLGSRASNTGQVRTNQFMQPTWMLREFKVRRDCSAGPCTLGFIPVTVKTNPGGTLFNPSSTHPLATDFQNAAFLSQVAGLAVNDINRFTLSVPDVFNSGQSNSQSPMENHYVNQFGTGPSAFRAGIQGALNAASSPLAPEHVVARAMALSCAGCHRHSNGANLGGGLTWPPSLGFTHISEQTDPGPDGPRHRISPALVTTFLPHRQAVLETFLNASCGDSVCDAWETRSVCSTDCP